MCAHLRLRRLISLNLFSIVFRLHIHLGPDLGEAREHTDEGRGERKLDHQVVDHRVVAVVVRDEMRHSPSTDLDGECSQGSPRIQ